MGGQIQERTIMATKKFIPDPTKKKVWIGTNPDGNKTVFYSDKQIRDMGFQPLWLANQHLWTDDRLNGWTFERVLLSSIPR